MKGMRILSVLSLVLSPSISFSYVLSRSLILYQYNHYHRYYHCNSYSIISNRNSNSNSYRCYSNSNSNSNSIISNSNDTNDNHKNRKKVHLLPRVYIPSSLVLNNYNDLDSDTSHYLGTVLRLKHGDMIRVFNPDNGEYLCEITDVDKDKKRRKSSSLLRILIKEQLKSSSSSSSSTVPNVLLYMAPIKKQRMKILLEKVTELGIDDIIPVVTQNTEKASIVNSNNNDDNGNSQYDRILIESSEQCERLSIPTLHQTLELEDLLKSSDNDNNILLVCRERYQGGIPLLSFLNQLSSSSLSSSSLKAIGLLVGPEGGFTQEEFETMSKCKSVKFISLGDNVLRAETAAINAISVINAYYLSK